MNNRAIATASAPAAIGPYSQGVAAEGISINVSGQLGLVPETGEFAGEDIGSQTRQSLSNIKAILAEDGATMADVVETTVLLTDIAEFGAMNEVYAEFFEAPYPARAAFQVVALPKGGKVEIKVVARI
jgi:2-iminobutanoate/2-iminopropanoate deaminase